MNNVDKNLINMGSNCINNNNCCAKESRVEDFKCES